MEKLCKIIIFCLFIQASCGDRNPAPMQRNVSRQCVLCPRKTTTHRTTTRVTTHSTTHSTILTTTPHTTAHTNHTTLHPTTPTNHTTTPTNHTTTPHPTNHTTTPHPTNHTTTPTNHTTTPHPTNHTTTPTNHTTTPHPTNHTTTPHPTPSNHTTTPHPTNHTTTPTNHTTTPHPTTPSNHTTPHPTNHTTAPTNHTTTPHPTTPHPTTHTNHTSTPYLTTHTNHTSYPPTTVPPSTEYMVNGTTGVCLRITASFNISINDTVKQEIVIPPGPITKPSGNCSEDKAWLILTFPKGQVTLMFSQDTKDNNFFLAEVNITLENRVFTGSERFDNTSLKDMVTPLGRSFSCEKVDIQVTPKVSFSVMNVRAQAFKLEGGNYGREMKCSKGTPNMTVPIVVGIILAVLILIVVIAYLVARRRSHRGYQSL